MCGAAATFSVACGVEAGPEPALGDQDFDIVGCTAGQAGGPWANQPFVAQTGVFRVDVAATPSASPIDAVVGFSDGPSTRFSALAAIVRFNPGGVIDVRAGSAYQADVSVPYTAGTTYRFHLDIDVGRHLYSVSVDNPFGGQTSIARNYAFRTEQAQVAQLTSLATQVDSNAGALQVCDLRVTPIDASGCPVAAAGLGFLDLSIGQPGEVVVSSDFVVTPDRILDGVIGLSTSSATSFDNLAATVRLAPNGIIDARDGGAYRADTAMPYSAGQPQRIRIIANVATHTFSVQVAIGGFDSRQLARRYAFRPSQATAAWLADLNAIVDSPAGTFSICNAHHAISIGVRLSREGNYAVAPLPTADQVLISDGATTLRVDSEGHTLAQLGAGGQLAVDPVGNVYLARIAGANLVVEAYTAAFAHRWTRSYPAGANHGVLAIGADGGSVVAAAGPVTGGVDLVKRWLTNGTESTTHAGPMGDAIAIGPAGFVIGSAINGTVVVTRWSFGQGLPDWQRVWHNSAHIDVMALAPNGRVYFGGTFSAPLDFGGGTLEPQQNGETPANAYIVALSSGGDHVYSRNLREQGVRSMSSNGIVTAISAMTTPRSPHLIILDSTGAEIPRQFGKTGFGSAGDARSVAVGPSSRVYWNFADAWPTPNAPVYPYLIGLVPGV